MRDGHAGEGDHLQELKDDFNEMLRVLEQRGAIDVRTPEARQEQGQPISA